MTGAWLALAVAGAGGIGAVARLAVDSALVGTALVRRVGLPLGTAFINVSGSFVLGLVTGWVSFRSGWPELGAVAGSGFCGGFTTFSAAMVEAARLIRAGRPGWAATLWLGVAAAGILAAAAGLALMA